MPNFRAQIASKQKTSFEASFSSLEDPRRTIKGHYLYPLQEILLLTISAVLSGFKDWTTIQTFGENKLDWLRQFYPYQEGIPSHDVLGKLFKRLNPDVFGECFVDWINQVSSLTEGEVVAIDGKSICGSADSEKPKSAVHIVSAYASDNRVCLGQKAVDTKSNEITAIPKLLELLTIKGCVVTIDAMGCQTGITKDIIKSGADYVLAVKGNQNELFEQVKKMFSIHKPVNTHESVEVGHGRVETRVCQAIDDLTFMDDMASWVKLQSVVRVQSERFFKKNSKTTKDERYYISSLPADAQKLNQIIRQHWSIENNLHWSLDVIFKEDSSLKKKDFSALNFSIINKVALAMLEKDNSVKLSKPRKMAKAALNDEYRTKLLKT